MPDDTHTFHAHGLLSKWGFGDGDTPEVVRDPFYDRVKAERAAGATYGWAGPDHDWPTDVLIPVARHLLAPAVPAEVEVYTQSTSHNPIRVRTVNGQDVDTYAGATPDVEALFDGIEVTLPVDLLVRALFREPVLAGLDRLSGMDLTLVGAALAAGLSVAEVADHRATLDLDTVRGLAALRAAPPTA